MEKEIYSKQELLKAGYPERTLERMCLTHPEVYFKANPRNVRSPIYFYRAKLDKALATETKWERSTRGL